MSVPVAAIAGAGPGLGAELARLPVNIDLALPVAIDLRTLAWLPSPSPGVWRKTLYRDGGETGPVTSLVRYDASSRFPPNP